MHILEYLENAWSVLVWLLYVFIIYIFSQYWIHIS